MLAIVGLAAFVFAVALVVYERHRPKKRLPPGPRGELILGNARSIPPEASWLYYTQLQAKYGDIVSLSALGSSIIVLNSFTVAHQLLTKRSGIYSNRPRLVMAGEIMGIQNSVVLADFGPYWREQRRLFQSFLSKSSSVQYFPMIEGEARAFVLRAMGKGAVDPMEEYRLTAVKVIMGVGYGIEVHALDDELVSRTIEGNDIATSTAQPGRFFIDVIPSLKMLPSWFPGAYWKRQGAAWKVQIMEMITTPYQLVQKAEANGTAPPSFTREMVRNTDSSLSDEGKMWTSASVYVAGTDTIMNTTAKFVLAMALYPHVQRKAQEELDAVIGSDRLPGLADQPFLPYLEAVVKEVLRWKTTVPLGIAHSTKEDDVYNGYDIPKGSVVIPNVWAITMNSAMYPSPEEFIPERFLLLDKKITGTPADSPLDPRQYVYGFGRRICPGSHFAEASLFMAIVSTLATTTILPALDDAGNEIVIEGKMNGLLVSGPIPFKCRFEPRSADASALLKHAVMS